MKCNKCGKEFSPKVWGVHVRTCGKVNETEDIRQKAKKAGIKSWHLKSEETLLKELEGEING